jgi:hypothetical protein
MSRPSSLLTSQVSNDSAQTALEEKQNDVSVAIGSDPIDFITVDGPSNGRQTPLFVSSNRRDEPVVTRRELWSYYRQFIYLS